MRTNYSKGLSPVHKFLGCISDRTYLDWIRPAQDEVPSEVQGPSVNRGDLISITPMGYAVV